MLLQTVKSRTLWLWGEIIKLQGEISYKNELLTKREELNNKLIQYYDLSKKYENDENLVNAYNQLMAETHAEIKKLDQQIKDLGDSDIAKKPKAVYEYTLPFKITALQSVDVTWDNPIGESYGLTSNFLQSWHNKPVVINFKGISYMGAFGGGNRRALL